MRLAEKMTKKSLENVDVGDQITDLFKYLYLDTRYCILYLDTFIGEYLKSILDPFFGKYLKKYLYLDPFS